MVATLAIGDGDAAAAAAEGLAAGFAEGLAAGCAAGAGDAAEATVAAAVAGGLALPVGLGALVGADGATLVGLAGWAGAQALNNKIMPKQAAACEAREPPGLRI